MLLDPEPCVPEFERLLGRIRRARDLASCRELEGAGVFELVEVLVEFVPLLLLDFKEDTTKTNQIVTKRIQRN